MTDFIDEVTRYQLEIERNVSSRGKYIDRQDLFGRDFFDRFVGDNYLSLQRRLFVMDAGKFDIETRYVLDEKLRRLQRQVDAGLMAINDVAGLNYALDSMKVTKEDNPIYFPAVFDKDGELQF